MTYIAKVLRPKIISFPQSMSGLTIVAQENILWPCHAFKVAIPEKRKHALNIFEETLLRLSAVESSDTGKLAEVSCLDKELVTFIQNRLLQLDLVDTRFEVTKTGHELIEDWETDSEPKDYSSITVYVDLLSGHFLPFVNTSEHGFKKITKINENKKIQFLTTSTGKGSITTARQLTPNQGSYWKKIPNSNDIVKVIKDFKKRHKRYALLNKQIDSYPPAIPMAEAITVNTEPELLFIHCKVIIQKGNSDFLITDGLGYGFSELFRNYLCQQEYSWLTKLKEKALMENVTQSVNPTNQPEERNEFSKKYPQIDRSLRNATENLKKAEEIRKISSTNKEQELKKYLGKAIGHYYTTMEWALRQLVAEHNVEQWEQVFSSRSYQENNQILYSLAKKIGFMVTKENEKILLIKAGKVRALFENNIVEMQTVLALSIAGAIQDNRHPFYELARIKPDFLSLLIDLKILRDPVLHGKSSEIKVSIEELQDYEKQIKKIIKILFPDFNIISNTTNTSGQIDFDQMRLRASIQLEKCFGLSNVDMMKLSIKEELIKIVHIAEKIEFNVDDKNNLIIGLASLLQSSFFEAIGDENFLINNNEFKSLAFEKIYQADFQLDSGGIPKSLARVNDKKILHACQGQNTTLGASFIAMMLIFSEDKLQFLAKEIPDLILLTANVAELRGHGNNHDPKISTEELNALKDNIFKIIKTLMEL